MIRQVSLSLPVSANKLYRHTSRPYPHIYLTAEAESWRDAAEMFIRLKISDLPKLKAERYFVLVQIESAVKGRTDADNLNKITLDALKRALKVDDYYYHVVSVYKVPVGDVNEEGITLWLDPRTVKDRREAGDLALRLAREERLGWERVR